MALLSAGVAIFSYRYLFADAAAPEVIAANRHFSPWIIVHAAGAATALLVGPAQFLAYVRRRWPVLHRAMGRVYVAGCATGGAAAIVLATGVSTGPVTGIGFGALGTVWLVTTGVAMRQILTGRVAAHRRWMIRSFALTLAAVTLRIYLPVSALLGWSFVEAYPAIAWLCWVPNLFAAEWHLRPRRPAGQPGLAASR